MTTDDMFIELEDKPRDTVIVTLKYKYDFEENYTIENQILEYDAKDDTYVWLNDWYEGQTYVEVLGYIFLSDVNTANLHKLMDFPELEKAIKHTEEVAEAKEHRQLAEWLRELKAYRKALKEIEQEIVNWNDIDNGKCRGLYLAASIIQHYYYEEFKALENSEEGGEIMAPEFIKGRIKGLEEAIEIIDERCREADYYTCEMLLSIRGELEKLLGKEDDE